MLNIQKATDETAVGWCSHAALQLCLNYDHINRSGTQSMSFILHHNLSGLNFLKQSLFGVWLNISTCITHNIRNNKAVAMHGYETHK